MGSINGCLSNNCRRYYGSSLAATSPNKAHLVHPREHRTGITLRHLGAELLELATHLADNLLHNILSLFVFFSHLLYFWVPLGNNEFGSLELCLEIYTVHPM